MSSHVTANFAGGSSSAAASTAESAAAATTFQNTPVRIITSKVDAPLMSNVRRDGSRAQDMCRNSAIIPLQSYLIKNNHTFRDRGENTISAAPLTTTMGTEPPTEACVPILETKLVRGVRCAMG